MQPIITDIQVSLPLPTKNQALASMQVLFFYPFSGFTTKFPPPLQRIAAASVHCVPPTHLQKNSKKISRTPQPGTSAGAFGGSLFGPSASTSAGVFGGASARSLLEGFLGSLCGHFGGGPARSLCSAPFGELLGHLWRSLWGAFAGTFGELLGHP